MATAAPKTRRLRLGPRSAGLLLTPAEFDHARFQEGWRYELINGVLVVSPTPSRQERGPNETLGQWLENYQEGHPHGLGAGCDVSRRRDRDKAKPPATGPGDLGGSGTRSRGRRGTDDRRRIRFQGKDQPGTGLRRQACRISRDRRAGILGHRPISTELDRLSLHQ